MASADPGTTFTDFRFEETSLNLNIGETYNNRVEYPYNSSTWTWLPYRNASLVSNVTSSNSSVATPEKVIDNSNNFYILITSVGTGTSTISADCQLSDGTTKTITCQVTVTSNSNYTDTSINNLIINKLTKAQYDDLLENEQINDDEIYMVTDDGDTVDTEDTSVTCYLPEVDIQLISFTIDNVQGVGTNVVYNALPEMTWQEWINSEYNVNNFIIAWNTMVNNGKYFVQIALQNQTYYYIDLGTTEHIIAEETLIISNNLYQQKSIYIGK